MPIGWNDYDPSDFFDEVMEKKGTPRKASGELFEHLRKLSSRDIYTRKKTAEAAIIELGITFTVYGEGTNIDRAMPFDIIPRVMCGDEWKKISDGLAQRLKALNMFINDLYNSQEALKAGVVPEDVITTSRNFRRECIGMTPAHGAWANICGSDLVRDQHGTMYVLEDNLRVPSGVSYMLENRKITKRVFPELFKDINIIPVDDYPSKLFDMLTSIAPAGVTSPEIVVLTPGIFNSAYFEHAFLAQQMGAELVEGTDLHVSDDNRVYMKTIEGLAPVDVIYRRIDDDFIDPEVFRSDSILGVPGLMRAWRAGNVAIANAPGTGVADDKVVYAYVPDMIRFFLGEEPLIPNVETFLCRREDHMKYVLEHLPELVVKPANESGGYGMLVGPHSTKEQIETFRGLIQQNPRNYIAQPTLNLSVTPTLTEDGIDGRHIDLRPFILQGAGTYVTAGGLTRVALKKGSLVVNSSQGGGSKDTWVIEEEA
ncbi:circularly permuted type 2 ATP-grasp protein [Geovibrio thiophilus]|uniref:Circularly permuted type 2 ATP-grasp protein n=1 Tax=Geovibrio thiophilus TaxID=139438 RepID=A0A3R5UUC4_9BACT|nr:circularly permuted type 2 ATP-grasp protein [Geovibrio thiophilus]QAR32721.1 circularly permuted type 2 ATP-grasp protein [Geovibrio thiophilus]